VGCAHLSLQPKVDGEFIELSYGVMHMINDHRSPLVRQLLLPALISLLSFQITPVLAQAVVEFPVTRQVQKFGWKPGLVPIKQIKPRYPRTAAYGGKEGWVQMRYSINVNGLVENVVVVDSYPDESFNRSAVKALERWEFSIPAADAGVTFPITRQMVITFKLDGHNGVRLDVGKKLKKARELIVEDKDNETAERYLNEISEKGKEDWLNMYELAALEQTYALLSFSRESYDKAITHGERTLRLGSTLDEGNIRSTHRLLFFSYFNSNEFADVVRIYDNWVKLDPAIADSKFSPNVETIRTSLNEGRTIIVE
jgi:TonB family protein